MTSFRAECAFRGPCAICACEEIALLTFRFLIIAYATVCACFITGYTVRTALYGTQFTRRTLSIIAEATSFCDIILFSIYAFAAIVVFSGSTGA